MRGLWTAPFREEWKRWRWPIEMDFEEHRLWPNLEGYDAWVCNPNQNFVVDEYVQEFSNLKAIFTPSTGETHINRKCGLPVFSLLDDRDELNEIRASSEFAFLMTLNALRRIDRAANLPNRDENYLRGYELYLKLIGLVGHGRIGKNLDRWFTAFGAGVYWNDPYVGPSHRYRPSVEWMFRACNIIVICCSLTDETRGMITGKHVRDMQEGGILVNISRGAVIDDVSVIDALRGRPDVWYHTDVVAGEESGMMFHSKLYELSNVVVYPHIGGTTYESQEKAARITLDLIKRWIHEHSKEESL